MKIYTGTGDRGKTSLFSGERISKSNPRIEAYGDLDELNSTVGAVAAAMETPDQTLKAELRLVQRWLLEAGAWLATIPGSPSTQFLKPFTGEPATTLETAIDRMNDALPELKHFVLPGGHLSASLAHMARTVCRRAERRMVALVEHDTDPPASADTLNHIQVFLNRLSDYLFVVARYCNLLHGQGDELWKG